MAFGSPYLLEHITYIRMFVMVEHDEHGILLITLCQSARNHEVPVVSKVLLLLMPLGSIENLLVSICHESLLLSETPSPKVFSRV